MRIGLFSTAINAGTIDDVIAEARRAAAGGFSTYWASQVFSLDALTTLAIVGRDVAGIELGTAVVPTYPRHPWVMAQQALTTQAAIGGRLALGVGPSHQVVIEGMWGLSFGKPILHLREYLEVLVPLSKGQAVDVEGQTVTARGAVTIAGAEPFPVLVSALGTQMLELAGRLADGTITWCVGPRTLAAHTVPTLTNAAERAGRAIPRVVAMFPIGVTADRDAAHQRVAKLFQIYGQLPSYRAMLDREGATTAADLAILGDEAEITDRVGALKNLGVTDLAAVPVGGRPDEVERTDALLQNLVTEVA